jgi:hypothetical protein
MSGDSGNQTGGSSVSELEERLQELEARLHNQPPPSPFGQQDTVSREETLLTAYVLIGIAVALMACVVIGAAVVWRRKLCELCAEACATPKYSDGSETLVTSTMSPAAPAEEPPMEENRVPKNAEANRAALQQQSEVDRRRLRERIAGVSAVAHRVSADALLDAAQSPAAVMAAEKAVAAAGSPGAALLAAVSRGASAIEVRALLLRGANPDASFLDQGALSVAARCCSSGAVKALIDAGAKLDMKDGRGWTALMHAIDSHSVSSSREATVTLLLDAGAAVDVWGNDLRGPLDLIEAREQQQEKDLASGVLSPAALTPHSHLDLAYATNGPTTPGTPASTTPGGLRSPRRLTTLIREKSGTFSAASYSAGSSSCGPSPSLASPATSGPSQY